MDPELLQLKLAHHEAMVTKLQDTHPELAMIWLQGVELLIKQIESLGSVPDTSN
jgi:hypothetical protein